MAFGCKFSDVADLSGASCEVVSLGWVFHLLSFVFPTVAAFVASSHQGWAATEWRGFRWEGKYRHHSVMQAGRNVFQCSSGAFF